MEGGLSLTMKTDKSDLNEIILLTCLFTVIEKLRDINCTHVFRDDGLHITCSTVRRYRAINRLMGLKLISKTTFKSDKLAACEKLEIPKCEHFISQEILGIGNKSIKSIIYPYITDHEIVEIFGDSRVLDTIKVDYPKIGFEEGCDDGQTNKNCTVRRLDNSGIKTTIRCFVNGKLVNETDARSLTISLNAEVILAVNCYSNNSFGWNSTLPTLYFNIKESKTDQNVFKIITYVSAPTVIILITVIIYLGCFNRYNRLNYYVE
ncbi:uncharacterized protein LOC131950250 [Physella acuta]|uniref:uncharacterized protein LOC131950250 n=1 Tax=Physella acuta TaxID=109671 RepID=UPI0027DC1AF6|nr:uncharacterized protein LOC131950250 [Physella acuta]XP_059168308.1 uncharacterized protein LOC131950250 [Physella acuta]